MNLQRMRFAQARGAGIESQIYPSRRAPWFDSTKSRADENDRVCPGDEHLQYGPLSAALIDNTVQDDYSYSMGFVLEFLTDLAFGPHSTDELSYSSRRLTNTETQMYKLFLAEALADVGL